MNKGAKVLKAVLFIAALHSSSLAVAQGEQEWAKQLSSWTNSYNKMVRVLSTSGDIGDCGVTVSQDPTLPKGSFILNIVRQGDGLSTFLMHSPKGTGGRTQATLNENKMSYLESDLVGWVHLEIILDKAGRAQGLTMYKTLPSGKVYSQSLVCGELFN